MTTTNLVTHPWIPVIFADGHSENVSLESAFTSAHLIRDLALRPHERISVMRLLLCVTHAALNGPADAEEWSRCRHLIPNTARKYLQRHLESFGLDRFLQVDITPKSELKPFSKLDSSLATGNNHTLFDNGGLAARRFE